MADRGDVGMEDVAEVGERIVWCRPQRGRCRCRVKRLIDDEDGEAGEEQPRGGEQRTGEGGSW